MIQGLRGCTGTMADLIGTSNERITWDGRTRKVTSTIEFDGTRTGVLMAVKGWEPRWYMLGKTAFVKSKIDGRFFPYTHAPEVAPGLFPAVIG